MWTELLIGLSLMFVIEGFIFAVMPGGLKRALQELMHMPTGVLRTTGIASMLFGLLLLLMVK
ncbi:MAG TPA: DUF2065 domain-containing protein [Gammaproteobacteria bacterium]|jgi:uncharacterized protein YjeT (DUF2065 family)|nr:DUF2065 domain-containing protein [Gammaproteobacteria bacterium]